jgi:hypothetical protein
LVPPYLQHNFYPFSGHGPIISPRKP